MIMLWANQRRRLDGIPKPLPDRSYSAFSESVKRKEPGRWATCARRAGTAFGIMTVDPDDEELDKGDGVMPPMGIPSDITKELRKRTPPELLGSLRRLHV